MKELTRRLVQAVRPTPAKIYNASIVTGLALVGTGVAEATSGAAALIVVGVAVVALAVFERVLPLLGRPR